MNDRTILLVEDNPVDEKLTLRAFRKHGVADQIVVVRDGEEALDYLFATGPHAARSAAALPALILLDLKLPKTDGLDVLQRVRADERTRIIPVVILTSSTEQEDMLRSYRLCANSYVRKPVDFAQLSAVVAQLGTYWLLINQVPPRPGTS